MKLIGHVSVAALAAAPLIHYRGLAPAWAMPQLTDWQLLTWVGIWAALPDIDIVLSRFLPIKHRGFLTHSLYSALFGGLLVLAGWLLAGSAAGPLGEWSPTWFHRLRPAVAWLGPFTAGLAGLSLLLHVLGDSLTKSGVPLCRPDQEWHFPVIGGYAAFDNYLLNAIPLALAGYVLAAWLGIKPAALTRLGHLSNLWNAPRQIERSTAKPGSSVRRDSAAPARHSHRKPAKAVDADR